MPDRWRAHGRRANRRRAHRRRSERRRAQRSLQWGFQLLLFHHHAGLEAVVSHRVELLIGRRGRAAASR